MSVRVMSLVWSLDLPDSQKIVLLALADCANDEGHCWPSMASLSKKCSKGERTIQGVVKELVAAGHLTRKEVPGKGCNYYVHPRSDCAPATPAETAPRRTRAPQGTAQTPAAAADKPSRTIIKGLADAKPTRARDWPEIPDWIPVEPWNAFLAMRKRKRAFPTDRAVKLMLADLEIWRANGHDPGKILDKSTLNNWTGLFEPNEPKASANGNGASRPAPDEIQNPYARAVVARQAARSSDGSGQPDRWP